MINNDHIKILNECKINGLLRITLDRSYVFTDSLYRAKASVEKSLNASLSQYKSNLSKEDDYAIKSTCNVSFLLKARLSSRAEMTDPTLKETAPAEIIDP
jgi:hypothetical protein